MPICEYVCLKCKKEFEVIRSINQKDASIPCEMCGSRHVKRKLALVNAHKGGSSVPVASGSGGGF